ncbi:hypothetical protein [Sphingomonas sp. Leaf34]|nr:hypothetical protein [Sphingomonas sp. Leaf34]
MIFDVGFPGRVYRHRATSAAVDLRTEKIAGPAPSHSSSIARTKLLLGAD